MSVFLIVSFRDEKALELASMLIAGESTQTIWLAGEKDIQKTLATIPYDPQAPANIILVGADTLRGAKAAALYKFLENAPTHHINVYVISKTTHFPTRVREKITKIFLQDSETWNAIRDYFKITASWKEFLNQLNIPSLDENEDFVWVDRQSSGSIIKKS